VRTLTLLVTERGQPMNAYSLLIRPDMARQATGILKDDLQHHDMLPKATTEIAKRDGTRQAQKPLRDTTGA
jgi:hypothetical protein